MKLKSKVKLEGFFRDKRGIIYSLINLNFGSCLFIKSKNTNSIFTKNTKIAKMPIAHNEGNYFVSSDQLKKIEDNDQIAFQYCDHNGNINDKANPNGSLKNIAGILNKKKNVLGMMPHPERAAEIILGCDDGKSIFKSFIN